MKLIVFFLTLIFLNLAYPVESDWDVRLRFVNQDILLAEKTSNKDQSIYIRLFELYGEKLLLLIEKENSLILRYLESNRAKGKLDNIRQQKKELFIKLGKLSKFLSGKVKSNKIKTQIYYYTALYSSALKKENEFFRNIKLAEKYVGNGKLKHPIYVKIAEHYYNQSKFSKAKKYYAWVIKNKRDQWLTKHLYNYGWVLIKTEKYRPALKLFIRAHFYQKKGTYFQLGEQLINGIMFAYSLNHDITLGLKFLTSEKLLTFERILLFNDYNFEHGNRKKQAILLKSLKQQIKNSGHRDQYYEKFIIVNRSLKQYRIIDAEFKQIREAKSYKMSKDFGAALVSSLLAYTGFLQEVVKRNASVLNINRKTALSFIENSFNSLVVINPDKKMEYIFYKGETYYSVQNYSLAIGFYKQVIDLATREQYKEKIVQDSVSSILKSLEFLKGRKIPMTRYIYQKHIQMYPRSARSKKIYQNWFNLELKLDSASIAPLDVLVTYQKHFPKDKPIQIKMYKKLVNRLVKLSRLEPISKVEKYIKEGKIKVGSKEESRLHLIQKQIVFNKFDALEKTGKISLALSGILAMAKDVNNNEDLRVKSYLKLLSLLHKYKKFIELSASLNALFRLLPPSQYSRYKKQYEYYTSELCYFSYIEKCQSHIAFLYKTFKFSTDPSLLKQYFKASVSLEKNFSLAFSILNGLGAAYKKELKDYFLQNVMLLSNQNFLKIYLKYSKSSIFKTDLDQLFYTRILTSFFLNQDYKIFFSSCQKEMRQNSQCQRIINELQMRKTVRSFKFKKISAFSNGETKFEIFGKELQSGINTIQSEVARFEKQITNTSVLWKGTLIKKGIEYFDQIILQYKTFKPRSKEANLVKAIKQELSKIIKGYTIKKNEYQRLYNQVRVVINDRFGANRTNLDPSSLFKDQKTFNREMIWLHVDKY